MDLIRSEVFAGSSLGSRPWWIALHRTINLAYRDWKAAAFPASWTRLSTDPAIGAERLAQELGPNSYLAVFFVDDVPIACGGVHPYPHRLTIEDKDLLSSPGSSAKFQTNRIHADVEGAFAPDGTVSDWEICCFCVHPDHRHRKLGRRLIETLSEHVRPLGGKRLISNYVVEENGTYWPAIGFETVPGAGGMLPKGWKPTPDMEGLKDDIHFGWGIKEI